jgi:hypothetical protein
MYVFAYDREASTVVGAKVGEPCTDRDYERIVESITRLLAEAREDAIAWFILVIDRGQPPPSAIWRQRLAKARVTSKAFRFVIVSPSSLERGAVTAIHWIKPPAPGQKVVLRATFQEAVEWLEAEGGPHPLVHQLYARVREQGSRAKSLSE